MNTLTDLTFCVINVLSTHGLNPDCSGQPKWAGTPEQQAAMAGLHEALCAFLPPLPDIQDAGHDSGQEARRG